MDYFFLLQHAWSQMWPNNAFNPFKIERSSCVDTWIFSIAIDSEWCDANDHSHWMPVDQLQWATRIALYLIYKKKTKNIFIYF